MIVLYLAENGETTFSCCSSRGRGHAYRMLYQNYQREIGVLPIHKTQAAINEALEDSMSYFSIYEYVVNQWLGREENQHMKVVAMLSNEAKI